MPQRSEERAKDGEVAALLRAALEKIVFFEWRISELSAELASAQTRCAASEAARAESDELARNAQQSAQHARRQVASLEAERARLATLLTRPNHGAAVDTQALDAERERSAHLEAQLAAATAELQRNRSERERWLSEMIDQAKSGGEAPSALAQFISELRGEVISLRDRQKKCDALLAGAGIAPPPDADAPLEPAASRPPEVVEDARRMMAEGRLGADFAETTTRAADQRTEWRAPEQRTEWRAAEASPEPRPAWPAAEAGSSAARALADQCLRALGSPDAARRAQAARHLAAVPWPAAAPALASALHGEHDVKARAHLARALVACGADAAADIVAALQTPAEAPLVRLAALEALSTLPARAEAALETAAADPSPSLRRRAAAIAAAQGHAQLLARLAADPDPSVRAACEAAQTEPVEAPRTIVPAPRIDAPAAAPIEAVQPAAAAPAPRPAPRIIEPEVPVAGAADPAAEALLAVQAAMFGLTEDELAERTGLESAAARELAGRLVAEGRLGRRGKRFVLAEGGAA